MLIRKLVLIALVVGIAALVTPAAPTDAEEGLWEAARQGDLATIKQLHAAGVDLGARTKYGATALSFACDKGHLDVARFLIDNRVDVNTQDDFYEITPLGWTLFNDHIEVAKLLLQNGATGADQALTTGVRATIEDSDEVVKLLQGAEVKQVEHASVDVSPELLESYVGSYRNDEIGMTLDVRVEEGRLVAQATGQSPLNMRPLSESKFEGIEEPQVKLSFAGRSGMIERAIIEQRSQTFEFPRVAAMEDVAAIAAEVPAEDTLEAAPTPRAIVRLAPRNWPSFRGEGAAGVADGQGAPAEWDVESGKNIRWKTAIPGMANSSPIVWGDRIFVTTAISGGGDETFRSGLYGDVDSVDDESEHEFKVYALNKADGKIVWERTSARRVPGAKRHLKATQANSTPVTDGKHVVALFGTIGMLAAYDFAGKPLWTADLGILDGGWFYDKTYQWGHASSPVIYKDTVIVQADIQEDSFIAAYRLSDGKLAWKTPRDEVPTWGTPTVYHGKDRDELITNGTTVRGYDPATGKPLWSLAPNSEVTVATPVVANDLFYVTAGYPPVRPVYAIRPGATGDISLTEGADSSDAIAWSLDRDGTYMPTPIVYGDYLYTCANNGRLTCYEAETGERIYRARVGGGGTFTASPVAADGRLYFTDEDGDIIVIKAGGAYEEIGRNSMGEICMSTPAISDGLMVVRTMKHVYGIGEADVASGGGPANQR